MGIYEQAKGNFQELEKGGAACEQKHPGRQYAAQTGATDASGKFPWRHSVNKYKRSNQRFSFRLYGRFRRILQDSLQCVMRPDGAGIG
jgi:hypothetical protein